MTRSTTFARADEALVLAEADPGRAVVLATAVARQAHAERDLAAASVAARALGVAALQMHDLDTAIGHLRTAITLARRARSVPLAVDARLRLAFALNVNGRPRQALREIDAELRQDLEGRQRARALAQRGAVLTILGRGDEALASYRGAASGLRRAGDDLWLQRVLSNRGVLHGYRHEFAAAEADLREAEALCRERDLGLSLGYVHQNLGWLSAVRGDVCSALDYLHLAEQSFSTLRSQLGELLADRSEVLLSVWLISEAREAAEQAVELFEREGRQIKLPEVRLLLAQAAALEGDANSALEAARRAVVELKRQHRHEWTALARFVVLRSRLASAERAGVAVGQLVNAAEALVSAGWPAGVIEARMLAAQLALERGQPAVAGRQLELVSTGRRRGPATLRARAWHAEALLRRQRGNRRGARTALRAGLRILDEHRATVGATDLRAYASGHRTELAELGVAMALEEGRPGLVFRWAEEGRASHLLMRPIRPPDDPVLAHDLAELRSTSAEILEAQRAGRRPARLVARQVALERKIRDYSRRRPGEPGTQTAAPVTLPVLAAALQDSALVEFLSADDLLYAVTVVGGRSRLHELGPLGRVRDLVERIPFALQRLTRQLVSPASRDAATALMRHAARELDRLVLTPLAGAVGDRSLVLVPTGVLQSLPWSILPSCRGRPVTVAPSAALWHAARRPSHPGPRIAAAGPDLPGAVTEAEAVAAIHHTPAVVGAAATVEALSKSLDGAGLVHLAAHGHVHPQNPLFSSIRLSDGPLTVYDLERLHEAPQMVVLAACDSGRAVVCAGDELLGLTATFLRHGTRQVVASVIPVPDAETAPLMIAFHRLLASGASAAAALAQAQADLGGGGHAAVAAAAGFVCVGADYTLPKEG